MNEKQIIINHVNHSYRNEKINCATTILKLLGNSFNIPFSDQVIHAASGMHGAGRYGAQCGLVEGTLMFLGIYGSLNQWDKGQLDSYCSRFAGAFEKRFGSLSCSILRPEGFHDSQPPYLCMDLTIKASEFTIDHLK